MFKFVILLSVVACAFGAAIPEGLLPQLDGRIVGGTATTIGSFPWQISLQRSGSHSCGGSIYSANIIVTAAHCLQSVSASTLQVRAGSSYWSSGGVTSKVAAFRNHEGYNSNTMVNDIAVIRLSSSLSFSSNIKSIGLASSNPSNGASASVSGWGTQSSGASSIPTQLQYINTKIVSRSVCASSSYSYGSQIRATMICAAASGKDSCQGDSGGPLVSGGQLVGVVSWGIGCAYSNYPGVYSSVADLRSWVVSAAGNVYWEGDGAGAGGLSTPARDGGRSTVAWVGGSQTNGLNVGAERQRRAQTDDSNIVDHGVGVVTLVVPEGSNSAGDTTGAPVARAGANLKGGGGDGLQAMSSSHDDVGRVDGTTAGVAATTLEGDLPGETSDGGSSTSNDASIQLGEETLRDRSAKGAGNNRQQDHELEHFANYICKMFKFVILLSVVACALGASIPEGLLPQLDGRIVGGTATTIGSFPWQISLQRSGSHSCGGSIYSANIIVTAAHCLQSVSASTLQVRAGSSYWSSGGVTSKVAAFRNHEGYNSNTMVNDIAVIRLSSSLSFSSNIKSIGLASSNPSNGASASVSGWGTQSSGSSSIPSQLQYVNVNIVSQSVCASSAYSYGSQIRSTMICAAASGKDACQGDSGGPLVSGGQLVGVVSWGIGCAYSNYPGVYASVADLRSWVVSAAGNELSVGRIIGGTATTISNFPWQVSLQRSGSHSCGGSVYSVNIIVTSARCLQFVPAAIVQVRAGSTYWNSGGILLQVSAFRNHEGYDANTMANDIAVVRLSSSLPFSSTIKAIDLANYAPANGDTASVSGWGTESYGSSSIPSQLQYANVNIISQSICASSSYDYGSQIKNTMICAAASGKDACQGDSGGPLVSGGVLYYILKMFKFVILLSVVACAFGAAIPEGLLPQLDGRIVGGTATTIGSFPWQISLQRSGSHSCGGSIYSANIIVTAAHCLQSVSASTLQVRAGSSYWSSGGVTSKVAAFRNHEGYNSNTMVNDIAVIRLSSSLSFSSNIKSIGLASSNPSNGASASVSGWGTQSSGSSSIPSQLQYVNVNIVSQSVCASSAYSYGSQIRSTMICAAASGKDACQGDSGGPLVSGGQLVGVVSWGIGCAYSNYPGVYASVADLRSWVVSAAGNVYYICKMFKFVILLSVVACAFGASIPEGLLPQLDGRIVGGTATTIGSFPWQISLQRSGSHSCGGSIYSANIIVTAAHCLQSVSASTLQVRAGSSYWSSGGVTSKVAAFRNHEGYNSNTMVNDIAVIRLSSSLSFSSNIKSIGLASSNPSNGASASVSGWGTQSSGSSSIPSQLQYVNVNIVSQSVCASSSYSYGSQIRSTMICAAASGKDACQGDSGGPLVSGGQLVGVVSWGIGCAYSNYPGVYASVADLRSWVVSAASNV
ncbi:LOW QUALITY PROTEIN: uncharacterized protein LOC133845108 [Drosophila sulfurigaster albostrigata]|uniref:LOW QUALITY PROTEIN: uncharacterized protein LOC133845108 n=1 Tax=Drosophila sulfurigaster albostrigata TaxID=89887 RepID=UPI002D21D8D1|nr:LOW QUALITY PROTEIN: uncharacterized protein LOC133845108 [Drosophila sulfurigaster albostrigata]